MIKFTCRTGEGYWWTAGGSHDAELGSVEVTSV